jgi:hypothetical protein
MPGFFDQIAGETDEISGQRVDGGDECLRAGAIPLVMPIGKVNKAMDGRAARQAQAADFEPGRFQPSCVGHQRARSQQESSPQEKTAAADLPEFHAHDRTRSGCPKLTSDAMRCKVCDRPAGAEGVAGRDRHPKLLAGHEPENCSRRRETAEINPREDIRQFTLAATRFRGADGAPWITRRWR